MKNKYKEMKDLLIKKFDPHCGDDDWRYIHLDEPDPADPHALVSGDPAPEMVAHPAHYNHGDYETIDVIEDWSLGFHCGNAIKYISRHKHKGAPIRDLEKAIWYLERYLELLKEQQ